MHTVYCLTIVHVRVNDEIRILSSRGKETISDLIDVPATHWTYFLDFGAAFVTDADMTARIQNNIHAIMHTNRAQQLFLALCRRLHLCACCLRLLLRIVFIMLSVCRCAGGAGMLLVLGQRCDPCQQHVMIAHIRYIHHFQRELVEIAQVGSSNASRLNLVHHRSRTVQLHLVDTEIALQLRQHVRRVPAITLAIQYAPLLLQRVLHCAHFLVVRLHALNALTHFLLQSHCLCRRVQ
mmetsp:Transcript_21050/g.33774  ORF Transcript_21050/g.33774 Transcript_21050/m.33774 type:complete len:237 (+) Transcript_21050:157-867(+)